MIKRLCLLPLFWASYAGATDYSPWIGNSLELQGEAGYLYQRFKEVDSGDGDIKEESNGNLLFAGLKVAYQDISGEIELFLAKTDEMSFGFSHARETFRYQPYDELNCDPVSLVFGVSLAEALSHSLKDFTFIHHGHFEAFFFGSIGKELTTSFTRWCSRVYATAGIGFADIGSPWIDASAFYEKRWVEGHLAGAGASFGMGFGKENLCLHHFDGYGPVRYREANLKAYYIYDIDRCHALKALVDVRVYADNCPRAASFSIAYLATFGL